MHYTRRSIIRRDQIERYRPIDCSVILIAVAEGGGDVSQSLPWGIPNRCAGARVYERKRRLNFTLLSRINYRFVTDLRYLRARQSVVGIPQRFAERWTCPSGGCRLNRWCSNQRSICCLLFQKIVGQSVCRISREAALAPLEILPMNASYLTWL